jgi:hypothetical protein
VDASHFVMGHDFLGYIHGKGASVHEDVFGPQAV